MRFRNTVVELRLMAREVKEEKRRDECKLKILFFPISFTGWLGSLSMSVSLFVSPLVIGFCRRKSTRLTAVMGGLVTALGCLFTSFASQFHQLFFSYGAMIGKLEDLLEQTLIGNDSSHKLNFGTDNKRASEASAAYADF